MLTSFPSYSRHFYPSLWFPSVTYFRKQFLRKMWPVELAFILLWLVGYSSPRWIFVTLLHLSRWSVQLIFFIGVHQHISKLSRYFPSTFGTVKVSAPYYFLRYLEVQFAGEKNFFVEKFLLSWQSWMQFHVHFLLYLLSFCPKSWNIPLYLAVFDLSYSVLEAIILRFTSPSVYLHLFTFHCIFQFYLVFQWCPVAPVVP